MVCECVSVLIDATYQVIMNCRLRKGVLCVMLIRYAGHRLGHRQWPCAVYLGSHCTHSTNTEIQRKTQMTEAIDKCCISWIILHRAYPGYYERLQVLCFRSHHWILQFSDPSAGSSKRDLFLLKQWSFRSMECLAHKKFQIPSTWVVHTDTASGSPEHLQLIVLLEHTRTWYWPSIEGAPGSSQHFV